MKKQAIICGSAILTIFIALKLIENKELTCRNLVREFSGLPSQLEFVECDEAYRAPVRVLEARYKVPTQDAKAVESYLRDRFEMTALKFVCCGWETMTSAGGRRYGSYTDKRGYNYTINMYSGELIDPEKPDWSWDGFAYFNVLITAYLEDP